MPNTQTIKNGFQPNTWFKPKAVRLSSKALQIETHWANGFLTRLRGLLWSAPLQPLQGLLLTPCNNIHTVGMAYAIDVIFLSPEMKVIRIVPDCQPYRFLMHRQAKHTLELLAGQAEALNLNVGMQFSIEERNEVLPK